MSSWIRALGAAALLAAVAVPAVVVLSGGAGGGSPAPGIPSVPDPEEAPPLSIADVARFEPFAYQPDDDEELLRRGRDGLAHVIYAKSPGGVRATVARVRRFDEQIETAAGRAGVSAETLRALVFLESGGRPDVEAAGGPDGAVGLAQILPGTATALLGMRVDLERSKRIARAIARDRARVLRYTLAPGRRARRRLRAARRRIRRALRLRPRVDERYDARKSLAGAARYVRVARRRFGREDLAAASYHMGIGNLERVVEAYVSPRPRARRIRRTVARYGVTFPRLYFDSSPVRNPRTHRLLTSFGDDSRHYLFRLEASREILRLAEEDPGELDRLVALQSRKASAEEVLRPRSENEPFEDGDDLEDAYDDGDLLQLPNEPARLGFRVDPDIGELARAIGQPRRLYRGLRPEALATLLYLSKEVQRIAGRSRLVVTSTVRDLRYQRRLALSNVQATRAFSLHTTGYAIDLLRRPRMKGQERAVVTVLERLRALNVIDWVYEPTAIHLTVGPDGERFEPLLDALLPDA
jgi:hypothetical protein